MGDYDFWFDWSSREINATVQIAHISNFMQSLNQIQVFTPIHGLLVEAELRNFNIWDKEKIQKAVEETFKQMQEVQAMQNAQPGQTPAPGSPPSTLEDVLSNIQSGIAPQVQSGVPNA